MIASESLRSFRVSPHAFARSLLLGALACAAACGTDASPTSGDPAGTPAGPAGSSNGPDAGAALPSNDAASAPDAALDPDPLVGLWDVSGSDARGAYTGRAE